MLSQLVSFEDLQRNAKLPQFDMSYQRITPFAALGRPLEKRAFVQGMKDVGNGLWNTMAGKANARGISNGQDWNATKAGVGGMMDGGFHGAGAAADKSYNADNAARKQQTQRADAGWNQAKAGVGGMVGSVGKYFSGIGDAVVGNSPAAAPEKSVSTPTPSTQPTAPATPQQPPMNQFNQPGGWTTGPNGEIQPMQKQSAFAQLGKRAYGMFTASSGAPTAPSTPLTLPKMPQMPAMANIAPLGGSAGAQYGQTIKAPAAPQFRSHGGTSLAAIAGRKSTGASNSAPPEVRNQVAEQVGVPAIMPDQIRATASGPTAENIAAFRKSTGTNFNAKSKMDMQNMRRLMGGADTMDRKQYGTAQQLAGPQPTLAKTAFAQLEKVALAKGVSKLLGATGRGISSMGSAAKASAKPAALKKIKDAGGIAAVGGRDAGKAILDKAKLVGDKRLSAGAGLQRADNALASSKGAQNAINYGAGTVAGGAGLIGAHSMGRNSGREEGVTEGTDRGIDLGLQGAQAMQPGDPGFMGRLGDLFTGTQAGPDAATMRQGLSTERDKLIQSLLAR